MREKALFNFLGVVGESVLCVLKSKIKRVAAGIEPLKRGFALLYNVNAVIYRTSVLRGNHKIAYRLIAVFFRNIANGKEITERLRHLYVVNIYISVVHPVMCKGNAVAALALCYFVLMVREYEVLTAAMNIDGLAEKTSYHCRALNMPARSAVTPR